MVSPFCTLQSANSLRNSIASLAWFSASCMGCLRRAAELALLRRLLPGVAMALGLGLELELLELLAVAHAVAENLVLAGEILRRAVDRRRAVPGGGLHGEIGIHQMWTRQRHQISTAGGDDGVDL